MSFIGWMCQRGLLTSWVSWCTAVFTVRHLGTSPTISSHPPTSLLGFVCIPQTDTSSSYLAVDSTHTAIGRFRLLVRRSGTRCLTSSVIRRVVLTVLSSFLRQPCLVFTNVISALEVFLKCYALYKSTFYLLTFVTGVCLQKELIREVEMGPFKHTVDDGLDIRKVTASYLIFMPPPHIVCPVTYWFCPVHVCIRAFVPNIVNTIA